MTRISKSYGLMICSLVVMVMCNSCVYVGALIMSVEEKKTVNKWKSGNYKTCIQRRSGWAGPYCYYCKVKEKKPGGLYYRKIVNEQLRAYRSACTVAFPVHERKDTIVVDLCKDTTFLTH